MKNRIDPTLTPLEMEDAGTLNGIQLVALDTGVALITSSQYPAASGFPPYRMTLRKMGLAPAVSEPEVLFDIGLLLPSPAHWEAAPNPDGQWTMVYEYNGGAVNALLLADQSGDGKTVSNRYPFSSFHHPHFIRSPEGPAGKKVLAARDKKEMVLFAKEPDGAFGDLQTLGDGVDGLLLETAQGSLLVFKTLIPGSNKFDMLPGRLHITRLTANYGLQEVLPALPENAVCYNFDACLHRGAVFMLAVTESGVEFFKGSLENEPLHFLSLWKIGTGDRHFTHPTIVSSGPAVYGALIENEMKANARVVYFKSPGEASGR